MGRVLASAASVAAVTWAVAAVPVGMAFVLGVVLASKCSDNLDLDAARLSDDQH